MLLAGLVVEMVLVERNAAAAAMAAGWDGIVVVVFDALDSGPCDIRQNWVLCD